MKNRSLKILIIAAVAIALIMAGVVLVKESGMDTSKVQEVYLEVVTEEGSIERIKVTDAEDVDFIKVSFNAETADAAVYGFEECGYRIILAQPDKEWHLYPNAEEMNMVRLGDTGDKLFMIEEQQQNELKKVFNKYIDTSEYTDACDWKQVIMEDIKN